jgi:hypothetical protein
MKRQALKSNVVEAVERATRTAHSGESGYATTSIHLPAHTLALLQELALERKLAGVVTPWTKRLKRGGTKVSVSAVIVELVEAQRADLEKERDTRRRARR